MHIYRKFLYAVRLVADLIVLCLSYGLSVYVTDFYTHVKVSQNVYLALLILLLTWVVSSQVTHLYDDFRSRDFSYQFTRILKNVITQGVSAIIVLFVVKEENLSRVFVSVYVVFLSIGIVLEKFSVHRVFRRIRRRGRNLRNVLIVGAGKIGKGFAKSIEENPHFGYKLFGFLDDKRHDSLNGRYFGSISELRNILEERRVDDVVIALPSSAFNKIESITRVCDKYTTRVRIVPDHFRLVSERYAFSVFDGYPVISLREEKINEYHWRIVKRAVDTGFSLFLFVFVFSWLWPIIALAIKFSSPGPVFFKQHREGRNNRRFVLYKFRSMVSDSKDVDENGRYQQAKKDDPRITKVGRLLRRTNFDELPQFINVLRGEMSLVGPRPHPIPLDSESREETQKYMQRYLVKPGITGWAQVHGHRGETRKPGEMQQRINYDLWYIENWSVWLDIQIIAKTVRLMVRGDEKAY